MDDANRRSGYDLVLTEPCDASLDDMTPVAGGRHCPRCDIVVRDLRRSSADDLQRMAAQTRISGERVCAWIIPDEPATVRLRRSRRGLVLGAALVAASLGGCEDEGRDAPGAPQTVSVPEPTEPLSPTPTGSPAGMSGEDDAIEDNGAQDDTDNADDGPREGAEVQLPPPPPPRMHAPDGREQRVGRVQAMRRDDGRLDDF